MITTRGFLRISGGLGLQDVRDAYRRSSLGPLWSAVGLGLQVLAIGFIFGFLSSESLSEYLPFLAISLALWNLVLSTFSEASGTYVSSERFLRQMQIPYFFAVVRLLSKNFIIFLHNLLVVLVVTVVFPLESTVGLLWAVVGLALVLGNLYWVATLIAIVGARFRDLGPIVTSLLTLGFYLTPIIWMPSAITPEMAGVLLPYNPIFHLMEIVRGPLLGHPPAPESWLVAVGLMLVGNTAAWFVAKRQWWRVVYWL